MTLEYMSSCCTKKEAEIMGATFYPLYSRIRDKKLFGEAVRKNDNNIKISISTCKAKHRELMKYFSYQRELTL